jgi:hypothetical protein
MCSLKGGKPIMRVALNTGILPIINVGMYESLLSPSVIFDDWLPSSGITASMTKEEIDYCEDASWHHFNSEAYKKMVEKYAIELVADFFQKIKDIVIVTLCKNAQIYSPREYNIHTDTLDFEIEIDENEIQKIKALTKNNQGFFTWLKNTYRSCPGFYCFMPNSKESFAEDIEGSDMERGLAAYFTFLLRKHLGCSGEEEFGAEYFLHEKISSNHGIEEFIEDERFHEIIGRAHSARGQQ